MPTAGIPGLGQQGPTGSHCSTMRRPGCPTPARKARWGILYALAMGSAGMRRKGRHRLPKVSSRTGPTVPPDSMEFASWSEPGQVGAMERISRAVNSADPRQRRAGSLLLFAVSAPFVLLAMGMAWVVIDRL